MANPAETKPTVAPLVPAPTPKLSPDALSIEQQQFAKKLAKDDAARDKAKTVEMIAIASFTRVDDQFDEPEVIQAGQAFEISEFDEPRFSGRARRRSLSDPHPAGATSNRE